MEERNWKLSELDRQYKFDLHPTIRDAYLDLNSYNHFVERLALLCKPNSKIFEEFKEGSKKAYNLLRDYWAIIQDASLSKDDRRKKSRQKLDIIEHDPELKSFYESFCLCLKIGEIKNIK